MGVLIPDVIFVLIPDSSFYTDTTLYRGKTRYNNGATSISQPGKSGRYIQKSTFEKKQ